MISRLNILTPTGHVEMPIQDLRLLHGCILSVDGSTDITGVGIIRESDGAIVGSIAFKREHGKENAIQYKVRFKREIQKILENNPCIKKVFYEEPFIGYAASVKALFAMRTSIQEIIYENEPNLDYVSLVEISNMKWKKLFLAPDKCPSGTENQKKAIRDKMLNLFPMLASKEYGVTQDELDALAMGIVARAKMCNGEEEELESQKKARAFAYSVQFIGADDDEILEQELYNLAQTPKEVMENGISLRDLKSSTNLDRQIYNAMRDDDKLLIWKFNSSKFANITLKYKIGKLASSYEYIYMLVWRKNRKR